MRHEDSVLEDNPCWYRDAIIYQVHIKAFADSNADGVGDFPGVAFAGEQAPHIIRRRAKDFRYESVRAPELEHLDCGNFHLWADIHFGKLRG